MNSAAQKRAKKKAHQQKIKAFGKGIVLFHRYGRELAFFGIVTAFGLKLPEIAMNAWLHISSFAISTWSQIMAVFGLA